MKTNPIGVRFNKDLLFGMIEDKVADSPQKVLNFLEQFYHEHRWCGKENEKPNFKELFEKSKLYKKPPPLKDEKPKEKETDSQKIDFGDDQYFMAEKYTAYPIKNKPENIVDKAIWLKNKKVADEILRQQFLNRKK